ncbi:MAG: hypothetical protein J6F31_09675 [Oscillospiraceae bacterium]|nr:hypothetical protein [Oscillospiraceae bacterium]
MIKRIYSLPQGFDPVDYHSGKIFAYYRAYGGKYDFCSFYSSDDAVIMLNSSNAVIYGKADRECAELISLLGAQSAECAVRIDIDGYSAHEVYLCCGKPFAAEKAEVKTEVAFGDVERVFSPSFPGIPADAYYTDLSHRVRHGVSKAFLYRDSFCELSFGAGGYSFLSAVCTAPESRGTGQMNRLLGSLDIGSDLAVICEKELLPFYEKIGMKKKRTYFRMTKDNA